jgi:DNA-binding PadR family transcriptional regulator
MRHRHEHHEHHDHDQRDGAGDRRRGAGRGGFGFGPGMDFGGPMGPGRGRGPGRGPGGRTRRGDIRIALLSALTEGPGHGYELIQRLEQRTEGRWRPSPGSVYPTLQLLEDSSFVTATQQDDKRVYAITEAGQMELQRLVEQSGMPPWATAGEGPNAHGDLRKSAMGLFQATKQVATSGTTEQLATVTGILDEARRKIYQLLAEA